MRVFLLLSLNALMLLEAYGFTDESDRQALFEFKSQVSLGKRAVLSSWDNTVHVCNWTGVTCGRKHKRVTRLELGGLQLGGMISPSIGNLTSLKEVGFGGNNIEGRIPDNIVRLTRMVYLDLSRNNFLGVFPPPIYNLSSLYVLNIFGNSFSGSLRADFGNLLPNLQRLFIGRNHFTGAIPTTLPNISNLQMLGMEYNNLTGGIPSSFGKLWKLKELSLHSNFLGSGSFGDLEFLGGLTNCTKLEILEVGRNRLGGSLA
ncbi:probable LRR receptor-like serine/threonine-protein kinase At3g47570 isoform X2 [Arabidopsis lyrata subsp. lyrata]|uniref:probable LRR receptor-like serine/threonine-protein kinase At3g47570 isoform X2 n=1 Tax=Arabidopsis lyrata subsp. lyrata TaxID=81972 RepID=UPI000A29CC03|nr:probable LRR receptor-like serine/threonine-protein kinase At3g47570 isoform X2 [Arabidopsis lyrata subsp. lyrata]|eukprot:XP_020880713.1 probable LRR receptor-like serine/threonine-protein kinase At3g47570 isoform X2 [Arabidopsis lyrata subsp. lyrata]